MRCNKPAIFLLLTRARFFSIIKIKTMKFFIDTVKWHGFKEANELGILDGVTTNPSLMAKEGIKGVEVDHEPL